MSCCFYFVFGEGFSVTTTVIIHIVALATKVSYLFVSADVLIVSLVCSVVLFGGVTKNTVSLCMCREPPRSLYSLS